MLRKRKTNQRPAASRKHIFKDGDSSVPDVLLESIRLSETGIWEYDPFRKVFLLSEIAAGILDISEGKITFDEFLNIIHLEDREKTRRIIDESLKIDELSYFIEFRVITGKNKLKWVRARGKTIFSEDGKPVKFFGVSNDITEIKHAEIALKKSEERLSLATESTDTGTWEYFPKTDKHVWSQKTRELYGFSAGEEITFEKILNSILPEDKSESELSFSQALNPAGSGKFDVEYRVKSPQDQTIRWLKLKGKTLFDTAGKPDRMAGVVFDVSNRKEVEIALKISEERLRLAVDSTGLGTWEHIPATGSFNWSARARELWGVFPSSEITEAIFFNAIHEEDRARIHDLYTGALGGENNGSFEDEFRTIGFSDLTERWVKFSGQVYFNENGEAIRAIGIVNEITRRKQIQEELRASESRFRSISDSNLIALAFADENGKIDYCNTAFLELLDFSGTELQEGKINLGEICQAEINKLGCEKIRHRNAERKPFETRLVTRTGKIIDVLLGLTLQGSREENLLIYIMDITSQKQYLAAIKESEQRFRILADAAPIIIWMSESDGTISYVNTYWAKYTGVSSGEARTRWREVIHSEDLDSRVQKYTDALETGIEYSSELRIKGVDGNYRWFMFRGVPRKLVDGNDQGYIGVGIDIHDKKEALDLIEKNREELLKMNHQLMRKNNDLDNFIYTASHDLRSPISNIEGLMQALVEILQQEKMLSDASRQIIEMIDLSVNRFKGTISDLTEISRIQKDAMEKDLTTVNFKDVLDEILVTSRELIVSQHVTISEDFSRQQSIVFSRKNLRSILFNLVSNSIKYRDPARKPEVGVKTERSGNFIKISVSDNGVGISEKDQTKVFKMFKRLQSNVEGSGIGLYLVKRIVDNAGGTIEVSSKPGVGSEFMVYLPVTKDLK